MTPKTLDFNCPIVTGGSGGFGRASSDCLISQGKKIITGGRTESTWKTAAKKMGNNTDYYVWDIARIPRYSKL